MGATALALPTALACDLAPDCDWQGDWAAYLAHAPTHPLPHPSSRAPWLKSRQTFVGASEIAAVVGANPYAGPLEVWAAKIEPQPEKLFVPRALEGGGLVVVPSTEVGNLLERRLLDDYEQRHGVRVSQPATRRHPDHRWLGATPDGCSSSGELVQVKVVGWHTVGDWDEGPPIYVLLQVQTEMEVWSCEACVILALCGSEIREYRIERDPELMGPAIEIASAFWPFVEAREVPISFDLRHTRSETFGRLWPEVRNAGLKPAAEEAIRVARAYAAARGVEKMGKEEKDGHGAQLRALIGDGEGFFWGPMLRPTGKVTWTSSESGARVLRVTSKED